MIGVINQTWFVAIIKISHWQINNDPNDDFAI